MGALISKGRDKEWARAVLFHLSPGPSELIKIHTLCTARCFRLHCTQHKCYGNPSRYNETVVEEASGSHHEYHSTEQRVFPPMGPQAWAASHLLASSSLASSAAGLPQDSRHLRTGNSHSLLVSLRSLQSSLEWEASSCLFSK